MFAGPENTNASASLPLSPFLPTARHRSLDADAVCLPPPPPWRRRLVDPCPRFNKREDDFPCLKEYNDYLEEVEDMTCNLIEGIYVASIEAKITKYEQENVEQIINARARKAEELAAALAASKGPAQPDTEMVTEQNLQAGESAAAQGQYAPAYAGGQLMQPRPMGMGPQPIPLGGPDMHLDDEEMMRLRAERVEEQGDGAQNSAERGHWRKLLGVFGFEASNELPWILIIRPRN